MATYGESASAKINAAPSTRPMSRIDHDIERVKELTRIVNSTTERFLQHARTMGYWSDPAKDQINSPTPVVSTLIDAIAELGRAIDANSGCINVFD